MNKNKIEDMFLQNSADFAPDKGLKEQIIARAQATAFETPTKKSAEDKRLLGGVNYKGLALIACCLLIMVSGLSTYLGLANQNYATYYLDVNPSIELVVNRFGKVRRVNEVNEDGAVLIKDLDLKGKSLEEATTLTILELERQDYLPEGAVVAISGYSKKDKHLEEKISALTKKVEEKATEFGKHLEIIFTTLTKEQVDNAKDKNVSPYKLDLIAQLTQLDDSQSVDELINSSITAIVGTINAWQDVLTQDVIQNAQSENISPSKYLLVSSILQTAEAIGLTNVTKEQLLEMSVADLKTFYYTMLSDFDNAPSEEDILAAQRLNVSVNKYLLIQEIIKLNPALDQKDLAKQSYMQLLSRYFALSSKLPPNDHTDGPDKPDGPDRPDDSQPEIDPAKLVIIDSILALDPTLDKTQLAEKSISELVAILAQLTIENQTNN